MATTLNLVILEGKLKSDITTHAPKGKVKTGIIRFTLVTEEYYPQGDKLIKHSEYHVVFTSRPFLVEDRPNKIHQGDLVRVMGKNKTRRYPDPGGGDDRFITEIEAENIDLIAKAKKNEANQQEPEQQQTAAHTKPEANQPVTRKKHSERRSAQSNPQQTGNIIETNAGQPVFPVEY